MSAIQSSIGLITGIPIQETVDQLIAISAVPRDRLENRNALLDAERLAVEKLNSLVLALQFEVNGFQSDSIYKGRTATSSDLAAIKVAVASEGTPAEGSYKVTPVQQASAQQLLSQSFDPASAVGEGSFTFRIGGFVDEGIALGRLNSGTGIERGEIRITDRSGASDVIDLRFATTVDDVLDAINSNKTINVTASTVGDAFKLTDKSGSTVNNLVVNEVGGGSTAATLGLSGIDVANNEATGTDVFTLHTGTSLATLNDGNNVQIKPSGTNDLRITFRDESTALEIDLAGSTTLGRLLDKINAADPARLSAAIAADGNRIELTDLTSGSGNFSIESVGGGTAAEGLGIATSTTSATITGERLVAGLRDVTLSTLKGGQDLGTLGQLDITNRDGVLSIVDLSAAETLADVVAAINDQATGVTASVNTQRHGIILTDTTGGSASNFIVADGDASNSATKLNIVIDSTNTSINSGSLGRQTLSEARALKDLGIEVSDIRVVDSAGGGGGIDLNDPDDPALTIGDVLEKINNSSANVLARINDAGDGIVIIDLASGSGTFSVEEVGSGTTATKLGLKKPAVNGQIDGTATFTVTIEEEDTLSDVVETINGLEAGVIASVFNDGTGLRLSLSVSAAGGENELLLDVDGSNFAFQEVTKARDSLILFGSAEDAANGILVQSNSDSFDDVIDGLDLTIKTATQETVTISVTASSASLKDAVKDFVSAYNSIRENLDEVTEFNAEDLTTGILFGTNAALRVDVDIARVVGRQFFGVGKFKSLEEFGVSFKDDGTLTFDGAKLDAALDNDPSSVKSFFTGEDLGFINRISDVLDSLAADKNSLLTSRAKSLKDVVDLNDERIETMTARLNRERERLLAEFFRIEEIVASLNRNLTALTALQVLPATTTSGLGASKLFE